MLKKVVQRSVRGELLHVKGFGMRAFGRPAFRDSWERRENAAGGLFQHPVRSCRHTFPCVPCAWGWILCQRTKRAWEGRGTARWSPCSQRREREDGLLISCAPATRGLRSPSVDARSGSPRRPPSC